MENLILKVNVKCGGTNNYLKPGQLSHIKNFDPNNTMVIGLDVNHPSIEEKTMPTSIAAAVGTLDANFTQYATSIRVQKKKNAEIVDQIDDMVEQLLGEYYQVNQRYPNHIILFRDGVGSGQFELVTSIEIARVIAVINKLVGFNSCKLLFAVVQKRHNARFIRNKSLFDDSNTKTLNMTRGTVVDTGIVEPDHHTFYLSSNFNDSVTSKPTKYIVLINQFDFTNDDIQQLVYALCSFSARSLKSISIPVPVHYADLAAYRAKKHLEAELNNKFTQCKENNEIEEMLPEEIAELITIKPCFKNQLYFC